VEDPWTEHPLSVEGRREGGNGVWARKGKGKEVVGRTGRKGEGTVEEGKGKVGNHAP